MGGTRGLELLGLVMFYYGCSRNFNGCVAKPWELRMSCMWGLEYKFENTDLSRGRSTRVHDVMAWQRTTCTFVSTPHLTSLRNVIRITKL
jgi:hypothetical protein